MIYLYLFGTCFHFIYVFMIIGNILIDKEEYGALNKTEFSDEKLSIKEICIPIKTDRLGNIITSISL